MKRPTRVMWLLNHTTLRQFELDQFKRYGITEIFLPKSFPYDEGNLSASVDTSMDASLSIPPEDLEVLNAQNWYETPSEEAWRITNEHFDIVVIAFFMNQVKAATAHFKGVVMLHVFGLSKGYSYTNILVQELGLPLFDQICAMKDRFWFAVGYKHLPEVEGAILQDRACYLPIGLQKAQVEDNWTGIDKRIFFICPRIGSSPYFNEIYRHFLINFEGFDYMIGGAQPVAVDDPKVIGFVSKEAHEANMRSCSVMFYHSQEPNHIHYHPFEAIRVGMPLIFMANGLLDTLGGIDLPGRCETIEEARQKIQRIMDGDKTFIESVRKSQTILLSEMDADRCQIAWQKTLTNVVSALHQIRLRKLLKMKKSPKRIALLIPVAYRGGSLRGTKLLAEALLTGSRLAGEEAEIVIGHLDESAYNEAVDFGDLPPEIKIRPYQWRKMNRAEARRAMHYASQDAWEPEADTYIAPDDGMKQFCDCDLWILVSDRVLHPLLPVRPYVSMIYDYIQRYMPSILGTTSDLPFLQSARAATRVLVTTQFTETDALNYATISRDKLVRVPMLAPDFITGSLPTVTPPQTKPYFIWTTNAAPHKNHVNMLMALREYYDLLDGKLDCFVTGVNAQKITKGEMEHLKDVPALLDQSPSLQQHLTWMGEVPDTAYRQLLRHAAFLCHAALIDNGTFSVIEAASLNVPSLSSRYPAMTEINVSFGLDLTWMDPINPSDMARQLKAMEENAAAKKATLSTDRIKENNMENLAPSYWKAVRSCL